MKAVKIFIVTGSVLLIIALSIGVYVWYKLQQLQGGFLEENDTPRNGVQEGVILDVPENEAIHIDVSRMSEGQKDALHAVGLDPEEFVVTETMVQCAEDALGKERYDVILSGGAPTPLESLSLVGCIEK